MLGVIYTITTNDGLYVGSTIDFKQRCREHKSRLKTHDNLLYNNISTNNGNYKIELYCNVMCKDKQQLRIFEEQYRIILSANLNSYKCYKTSEEKKQYYNSKNRNYYKNNNVTIICECGGKFNLKNKTNHYKTLKHNKYIALL